MPRDLLYYDDWMQAAYMARDFGVKLYSNPTESCWEWYEIIDHAPKDCVIKFYVHHSSEHVFLPNIERDTFRVIENENGESEALILQRDAIPFFMAKKQKLSIH